ncbi:MAG: hypothetical protein FWH27_14720 [Planctomycetaceae bacterium]|nr:hypothetical protein [Planctomycetaceae bacterium]
MRFALCTLRSSDHGLINGVPVERQYVGETITVLGNTNRRGRTTQDTTAAALVALCGTELAGGEQNRVAPLA